MGSEWKRYLFEDCMDAIIDYRGKTPKKTESGIPLITAKIIKNGSIQPVNEFIAEEDYESWMRRGIPEPGDIVLTTEAPLGEVAQLDNRQIALAQRVITLRGKKGFLDNTFLKYLLLSNDVQHQLDGRGTGTTVKGIKQSELRKIELPIPDLETQKSIAHIVGSLDNKIQLNRQANQTLEQMAQALFKSWFVDFDPVIDNTLAAGNPIPEALLPRAELRKQQLAKPDHKPLVKEILDLFPSEFEDTEEMGWVPKGWVVKPVSEAIQVNPKVKLPKGTITKFADMKALPTSGYCISEVINKAYSGGAKFENSDVLLARITPCLENGKTALVDFLEDGEVGFGSTEFIVLRGSGLIGATYVSCLARDEIFRNHCIQAMVGSSGRQRVQTSCFDDFFIALPDKSKVFELFSASTDNSFKKMTMNHAESSSLSKLRDTLLPKLISGELRLPPETLAEADQAAEA